jgi:hypothetical protein
MSDIDRQKLERYLARPLPDLEDELALYAPAERGAAEVWAKFAAPVRQRLCVEWDWCRVRQDARFENDVDLAAAVLLALATRALKLPIEVDLYLLGAIALKRGLDQICACP